MSECIVCGRTDNLVEITYENIDGSEEVEFYCVEHGRLEFQKEWKKVKRI